jgi:hypothetical protein
MPGAGPAVQRAVAVAPARTAPSVPGLVHAPVPTAGSPGSPALGHGSRRSVTPDRTIAADPVLALPVQRAVQIDELSTTPAAPDTAAPGATATDPAPTTSAQDAAAGGTPGAGDSAGAPAAAGGAGGATSEDMDALARKLVEPLTRRLRAEMLIERERRGVRSDAR